MTSYGQESCAQLSTERTTSIATLSLRHRLRTSGDQIAGLLADHNRGGVRIAILGC